MFSIRMRIRTMKHLCVAAVAAALLGAAFGVAGVAARQAAPAETPPSAQGASERAADRLKSLQEVGVIERVRSFDRGAWEYRLTESGIALKPFLDFAGEWGQRWVRSHLLRQELHPSTLMWDIHRFISPD